MDIDRFLKLAFAKCDKDKSGMIDMKELKVVVKDYLDLKKEPADDKKVTALAEKIMKLADKGGDGKMNLQEFIEAFRKAVNNEDLLRLAFAKCDTDRSGTIDMKELKVVVKDFFDLNKEPADDKKVTAYAEKIMKTVDKGGDGKISLQEFIDAFRSSHK